MNITVVYCPSPTESHIEELTLSEGASIADALAASQLKTMYPDIDFQQQSVGVFSRKASLDTTLHADDRVEFYRPLIINPMERRRLLAKKRQEK